MWPSSKSPVRKVFLRQGEIPVISSGDVTCVSSRHTRNCVTLLKLRIELKPKKIPRKTKEVYKQNSTQHIPYNTATLAGTWVLWVCYAFGRELLQGFIITLHTFLHETWHLVVYFFLQMILHLHLHLGFDHTNRIQTKGWPKIEAINPYLWQVEHPLQTHSSKYAGNLKLV